MRMPDSLVALFDYGVIDDVVRPLMSGKEAHVYLVVAGGRYAVAKIYKDAHNRSFKQRAEYTEGRGIRNSRDQRAIANRSKHGREKDEAAWRSTEVDMIHRLHAAGVRVPVPYHFIEGVLLMELVTDAEGRPAPRLGDLPFDAVSARAMYDRLIRAAVQMLCAGVVHGDLSEFNVLVGADGPVVIDFPQSIDTAHNTNARRLLIRDIDNLHRFLARHVPSARRLPYAEEMWNLHERNMLTPDTLLRGDFRTVERRANTASVLELIEDANRDERRRRDALGLRGGPPEPTHRSHGGGGGGPSRDAHGRGPRTASQQQGRGGAPKKDAPVYQGLRDEGLKFFRHLRDPQPPGAARNGQHPQGQRPRGQRPQEQRPQGQHPQGQHPQGQRPQGQHPQGQRPQGQRPQGQHPQGQRSQGQRPQGQRGQGPHSQGQRPQAHPAQEQRPQAQHSQVQRPQAQLPQGQHPQGQPPRAEPPQAQSSRGRRPHRHRSPR